MAFKKVVVKLHNIQNVNTGDDPGTELEIFGRFDVARLSFDPDIGELLSFDGQNLWNVSGDGAVNIEQGTAFIVESSATVQINQGEFLQITGHLGEQDTFGPNDQLGSIDLRFPLNNIATGLVSLPAFQESDQIATVKMSMAVAQQGESSPHAGAPPHAVALDDEP